MQPRLISEFNPNPTPYHWNTHISYAEDGSTVEVVLLDARANGAYPA